MHQSTRRRSDLPLQKVRGGDAIVLHRGDPHATLRAALALPNNV